MYESNKHEERMLHFQYRAEEARAIAREMKHSFNRRMMLNIASDYESIARCYQQEGVSLCMIPIASRIKTQSST